MFCNWTLPCSNFPRPKVKTLNACCYFSSVCAGRVSIIGCNHCTCWSFWKFDRNFCNNNSSLVFWATANRWWPTGLQHYCWSATERYRPNVSHLQFLKLISWCFILSGYWENANFKIRSVVVCFVIVWFTINNRTIYICSCFYDHSWDFNENCKHMMEN